MHYYLQLHVSTLVATSYIFCTWPKCTKPCNQCFRRFTKKRCSLQDMKQWKWSPLQQICNLTLCQNFKSPWKERHRLLCMQCTWKRNMDTSSWICYKYIVPPMPPPEGRGGTLLDSEYILNTCSRTHKP